MRHHHYHYRAPAPLGPYGRRVARLAALALLWAALAAFGREHVTGLLSAPLSPAVSACVQAAHSLANCIDVQRTTGDWRR